MLRPENPAYINLQAQLNSATSSLEALRATRTAVKRRLQDYAARLERTPEMEPDYLFLTRDRDTSGQKYQDIRSRLLEAKVSEGLEVQRKGERFSLIDPPSLPEKPDKPNRLAIVLLGLYSGCGRRNRHRRRCGIARSFDTHAGTARATDPIVPRWR